MPVRADRTKVMEPIEWAFPPAPIADRELIVRLPDGGVPEDRPPLLFVHGLGHGAWCWDEHWLPEAAARGWAAYAVSLRGHGGSAGHDELHRWKLRDYVHDVVQAITELPAPPVLVGHSMGALVVQRVLERYPAAPGAALVAPAGTPRHGLVAGTKLLLRKPGKGLAFLAGRPIRFDADDLFGERMDPVEAQRYVAAQTGESRWAQYQIVLPRRPRTARCPVLVLGGGEDRLIPPSDVARTAAHYGTRPHLFHGMGHDLMLDAGWRAPLTRLLEFAEGLPRR
jgi:pimeloyl-ACP methyl ester carboxylesterase